MKTTITAGWVTAAASLLSMVIGHLGSHDLIWMSFQISTYAATAPLDYFITGSMVLSALTLLIVGILVSKYQIFGNSHIAHLAPAFSGAAAFGLIIVAKYEETATTISALKQSGFWAIRVQSFHDAGLLLFFYSSVLLVMLLGILAFFSGKKKFVKVLGVGLFSIGPASYFLMSGPWPKYIGLEGSTIGVNQRVALFCLWLAVVLFLILASYNAPQVDATRR